MSFLYPMMLAGLAAISIPILIHLINKFRMKITDWGAMRFLLDSVRKNEKRVKIDDLLLLLLRCLLVVLGVLAFARPVLKAPAAAGAESGGPVAAVLLLDNSASMMQSAGAETRFDQAKKAVGDWLDQQGQSTGSLAALYLVSNRAEALVAKPEGNMAMIRGMLDTATVSDRGSEMVQGIRLACEALKNVSGLPREVRVYTDGQATGWLKEEELKKVAEENPGILIKPIFIGGGEAVANLGLTALQAEGGLPAARQPCRFRVEVANYGSAPVQNVRVALAIDDGPPVAETVIPEIAPGARQSAGVIITFPEAGPRAVTATLPPDAFAADNQRAAALEVTSQMNILLAEEDHAGPAMDRDGYFLANALIPLPRDQAMRYYLSAVFTGPAQLQTELANANNTATQAVFLCNVGPVSAATTLALQNYVLGGGTLVVFPGPRTDAAEWKTNAALWQMLPAELHEPAKEDASAEPLAWQSSGFTHPVTALWNDSSQGSLGAIKFTRHFPLTLRAAGVVDGQVKTGPARVVTAFTNGAPSVAEWQFGEGHVILFSSTATPEWNNFPLHPAFVPYLQRLLGYTNRRQEARLALSPGEAFRKSLAPAWDGKDFSVLAPGSKETRTSGQIASDERQTYLRFAGTERAGVYRVSIGQEPVAIFAVQMDPAESDLRPADPKAIEKAVTVLRDAGGGSGGDLSRLVITREFWTPLIWLLALFFIVESLFAHRVSQAR